MKKQYTYESAGVSIADNDTLVQRIQRSLRATAGPSVIDNPGGFAGFFRLGIPSPGTVLVACSDGVGSKVLLAAKAGRFAGIGFDLVAMSVNDLVTCGARPLFFLDYLAVHRNHPPRTAALVASVARACRAVGCALLGGETAEMPDLYREGEFDLAGFAVGVALKSNLITGRRVHPGDILIGLRSSGLHSNGYSLARKLFFEAHQYRLSSRIRGLRGTLGAELLRPTRIYCKPVLALLRRQPRILTGIAHITGGGLPGNVVRILPAGCQARIDTGAWSVPPIFRIMQSLGVAEDEMYRVFNMGIGMVLATRPADADSVLTHFHRRRIPACAIGTVARGEQQVILESS